MGYISSQKSVLSDSNIVSFIRYRYIYTYYLYERNQIMERETFNMLLDSTKTVLKEKFDFSQSHIELFLIALDQEIQIYLMERKLK